jgi:hypothetical protein
LRPITVAWVELTKEPALASTRKLQAAVDKKSTFGKAKPDDTSRRHLMESNGRQTGAYLPQRSVTIPIIGLPAVATVRRYTRDQRINGGAAMLLSFAFVRHFFGVAADQCRHTFRARCRFRELRDQLQRAGKTPKAAIIVGPNWRPIGHYVS